MLCTAVKKSCSNSALTKFNTRKRTLTGDVSGAISIFSIFDWVPCLPNPFSKSWVKTAETRGDSQVMRVTVIKSVFVTHQQIDWDAGLEGRRSDMHRDIGIVHALYQVAKQRIDTLPCDVFSNSFQCVKNDWRGLKKHFEFTRRAMAKKE